MIEEDEVTLVQIIRGSDSGAARRRNLSDAQKGGEACLVCRGTEGLNTNVGWVDDVPVKVHSYHVEQSRSGETTY
jgi:hypothetical protein